ncbi:alpha/beta fold hydrolase [Spongiactinospora sp. TRM90649]|uniref:alpha/beta fold hydrolase n=1 Tax=Spongiactinospora sp. TRM90649 TaxID=3031114 RepID=UPI0023F92676|nr:alpha/beta fold hydrolase [Spongiactinospora sp. TRM90649]MDF5751542.1 alpha/beta hydrolase [Spongiactinospora sp. TRM90649]
MPSTPSPVLLHSPLVGPLTWEATAMCLREAGHAAVTPSLLGALEDGPPYYPAFARAVADDYPGDEDGPVVLIAHSGAGALLPAVAAALGGAVRAAVFVDAVLPAPGADWFSTAPEHLRGHLTALVHDGRLPPWHEWFPPGTVAALLPDTALRDRFIAELPRLPVAYLREPAPPEDPSWGRVRPAYIRLSAAYDSEADEAARLGWPVLRADADHLAMLTRPETVATLIAQAIRRTTV